MRWLRIFLSIIAALLLAVTAFSFLGDAIDIAELTANFRPQLVVAAVLMAAIGLLAWSRWTLILAILAILANGWPLVPYYYPAAAESSGAADVTILVANLQSRAASAQAMADLVKQRRPDLIVLTEITADSETALKQLDIDYPFRAAELRKSPYNVLLLSRHRILAYQFVYPTTGYLPVLDARLCATRAMVTAESDGPPCYSLVALHAARPLGEGNLQLRNRQLSAAAGIAARDRQRPVLLAGDLNITPWSAAFGRLERIASLADASIGTGIKPTWFSRFPFVGLPIDHVLNNPGFRVTGVEVLPSIGSDHFPLFVSLAFAPKAAQSNSGGAMDGRTGDNRP